MAKHLTLEQLEEWHYEAEGTFPLFPTTFLEYFNHEDTPLHREFPTAKSDQLQSYWDCKFTFVLLILAAEEELDGYPMEAITDDSSNEGASND